MTNTKNSIMKMYENIQRGTEYILQAIPMDKLDYSVEPNSATIENLAFHISTLPLGAVLFADGTLEKFPETDVLIKVLENYLGDAMREKNFVAMFKKSSEMFIEYFGGKTDDQWINSTYKSPMARESRTYLEGFLAMQNHLLQHRGSLTSTLRSAGVPVTLRQYWGMKQLE